MNSTICTFYGFFTKATNIKNNLAVERNPAIYFAIGDGNGKNYAISMSQSVETKTDLNSRRKD